MTTFQYTLTLDDSEMIALTYAIDFYMEECIKKKDAGAGAPFLAHFDSLMRIRAKRHENARQTSGSTFGRSYSSTNFDDWVQYDQEGKPL